MSMRLQKLILAAVIVCSALSCDPKPQDRPIPTPPTPVEPEDPDPITMITIPGVYGVEGGDIIFDYSKDQLSVVEYDTGCTYRLINPETVTVVSVSGLPWELTTGQSVSFLYRVQKHGHSTVSKRYQMQVMQVKDGKAWLKQDDKTFIVLAL